MLASDWSKINIGIGCTSTTVQDRVMCNTPNRSDFQRVSFYTANLKCWLLIGRKSIQACFFCIFWPKTNIGCNSATVQDRSMCNTPNRSYFQRVNFFMANLKCWLLIGPKLIYAVFRHFLVENLYWLYFGNRSRQKHV